MMMLPEPTEVMPTRKPEPNPMTVIPAKDFRVGGPVGHALFDPRLEHQQNRNTDQQDADRQS